jgi:SAM-dependent methyltransferase
MDPQLRPLHDATIRLFAASGQYARHFAGGKLRHDPVFFSILSRGLFPDRGTLLDLGCGQGLLLALLVAAKEQYQTGRWPQGWPPPPLNLLMRGVELHKGQVETARLALRGRAQLEQSDIRDLELPQCSAIAMLDVLHYLGEKAQDRLLARAAAALDPGGLLLLREADAGAGLAFLLTCGCERLAAAMRGRIRQEFFFRSTSGWVRLMERLGLSVGVEPMDRGTPFANVLLVARRGA